MRERTDGTGFATRAIHAGERPDPTTHAHNTPIFATATFAFDTAAEKEAAVDRALEWDPTSYFYSRTGNPTNRALEEKVASLEGAEDCVVSASGMAAVASTLFAHLDAGDHIVVGDELFAITRVLWEDDLPRRDIAVSTADMCDLAAVEAAIRPDTKILLMETSTNPRLRMPDLPALAELAHRHGILVVADNTFLGPALFRPLEHGADLVLHAATKYLSGHGDAVSGVVSGPKALLDPIRKQVDTFGQAASPFSSFLVLRGVRTLPLRSEKGSANAAALAAFLEAHEKVEWVRYPGLASHPDHEVADAAPRATATGRWSRSSPAAGWRPWPPSRTTSPCATSRSAWATCSRSCTRGRRTAGSCASRSAARTSTTSSRTSTLGLSYVE